MQPTDNRGNPIPAHIKILDALTVLRGNTFMEEAGKVFSPAYLSKMVGPTKNFAKHQSCV